MILQTLRTVVTDSLGEQVNYLKRVDEEMQEMRRKKASVLVQRPAAEASRGTTLPHSGSLWSVSNT